MTLLWVIGATISYMSIAVITVFVLSLIEAGPNDEPDFENTGNIVLSLFWPLFFMSLIVLAPVILVVAAPKWIYNKLKERKKP